MRQMKNTCLFMTVFFISVFIFSSCSDDDLDSTPPSILVSAPVDDEIVYIGGDIHFECEFSDDIELHSYKIEIHNNFDEHNHNKSASIEEDEEKPFSYTKTWTFEQGQKNSHVHHHEISIPETIDGLPVAHGAYHFGIYCTDAAGNESHVFIDIIIEEGEDGHEHE
ncbi:DUF4625 domain-containing protein [Gaoshiqia sp. Z1-71]|uniref:DUF4625 domain-containing protein n=1 Tax=Gaoshiqia hydrogeniformans TaxID=3290090 RepID=UPI003BF7D035